MSYIVCILAFGLYWLSIKKRPSWVGKLAGGGGGKSSKGGSKGGGGGKFAAAVIEFVPFTLLAIATMTLADTAVGRWLTAPVEWVLQFPAGWMGTSTAVLAGVAFALMALAAILDLLDLKPDGVAKTAVIVLPFLVLIATGPIADAGSGLFERVNQAGTAAMSAIVGM